jgi:hypothetical protein
MKDNLKDLIIALLNDDHGITENAFFALQEIVYFEFGEEAEREFVECASATDSRFYFGDTIPSFLQ